ncbi:TPA: hypothetical protein QCY45_004776 [Bacillus cereus]|nr:hypothetical protein [Bacillus cereus]
MTCTERTFKLPVPIPQIKIDICNDVLCSKTRNQIYIFRFKVCHPNLFQVTNQVLGEAIASGAKIAAMKIITVIEPTAQIAIDAFNEGFNSYFKNQKKEIQDQFTAITTNLTVDTEYTPWETKELG